MTRDPRDRLADIAEAIADIREIVAGLDEPRFIEVAITDRRSYRALRDALTQIGEAVKALPADLRNRHPDVDWRGFSGLRDVLVHAYFRIDPGTVWRTVSDGDLDRLATAVDRERAEPADR